MKICIYFLAIKFCLILQYYSLHSCLLSDPFCIIFYSIPYYMLPTKFQNFVKIVSSKFFTYSFIFGSIIHNGSTFPLSLKPMNYLKHFLSKETSLNIIILLMFAFLYQVIFRTMKFTLFSISIIICQFFYSSFILYKIKN